MQNISKI